MVSSTPRWRAASEYQQRCGGKKKMQEAKKMELDGAASLFRRLRPILGLDDA